MGNCSDCGMLLTTVDVEFKKERCAYFTHPPACATCLKKVLADLNGSEDACNLTKRERFAAMAMQGYLANPELHSNPNGGVARASVQAADALLLELERTKP